MNTVLGLRNSGEFITEVNPVLGVQNSGECGVLSPEQR